MFMLIHTHIHTPSPSPPPPPPPPPLPPPTSIRSIEKLHACFRNAAHGGGAAGATRWRGSSRAGMFCRYICNSKYLSVLTARPEEGSIESEVKS